MAYLAQLDRALHTFRAYYPQFTTSVVVATIFAEVTITVGVQLSTMASHIQFIVQFLEMFFLAHGFCTFTNLFLFPQSARDIAFADIKRYLSMAQEVLTAESAYVESLAQTPILDETNATIEREHNAEYKVLKSRVNALSDLHSKLRADIALAKKDAGWSSISAADLDNILRDFRKLILPLRGMTVLMSIFRGLCERRGWAIFEDTIRSREKVPLEHDSSEREEWKAIFHDLSGSVNDINSIMEGGLRHVSLCLDEPRRVSRIPEPEHGTLPGNEGFLDHFEQQVTAFHARKGINFVRWLRRKGYTIDDGDHLKVLRNLPEQTLSERDREQYFVILYMQTLFHSLSDAILDLVRFSEKKRQAPKYLVIPSSKHVRKLVTNFIEDGTQDDTTGEALVLPHEDKNRPRAQSRLGAVGNFISAMSDVLGGNQSFFGFRVACAVLTVVIVALLERTQQWFFNQRCLWAAVFIPFSMAPSSGETLSLFLFRMIGTAIAVVVAIVNYYVVDGRPAGIIVFYFVFTYIEVSTAHPSILSLTWENYFVIRFPQYIGVWRSSLITRAIITGYTLQVQHTNVSLPPATNTQHYPVYLIGPYRYACTAVGVFSAFIWTIFPKVMSARALLRQKLGHAFYVLALYYSCMHSTVGLWATGSQGGTFRSSLSTSFRLIFLQDLEDKSSPGRRLTKIRHKIFSQEVALLTAIRNHARFSRFEPSMSQDFPTDLYEKILDEIDLIISYMNLVVHVATSETYATSWFEDVARLFNSTDFTSSSITTLLSLLSASIHDRRPLPPDLTPPEPYQLTRQLRGVSEELLSLRHAGDPGHSALAVIEVTMTMIIESLEKLLHFVKQLVGEIDFGMLSKNHEKTL